MNFSISLKILPFTAVFLSFACLPGCSFAPRRITLQEAAAQMVLENPTEPFRWIEYGRFCEEARNDHGAIQAYGRALELDGSYVPAYEHLGAVHSKLGQRDMAIQTFRRALDRQLESSLLWLGLGYCLLEAEEYNAALLAFDSATSLAEEDSARVSALLGRAAVLRAKGENEQAEVAIKRASAIDPEVLDILLNRENEI